VCLVGSQLLEQQEDCQLERRCFCSATTLAKIPEPEQLPLRGADFLIDVKHSRRKGRAH
jgi:putative transposase